MNIDSIYNEITLWHDKYELPIHDKRILVRTKSEGSEKINFYIGKFKASNLIHLVVVSLPAIYDEGEHTYYFNFNTITDKWAYLDDIVERIL